MQSMEKKRAALYLRLSKEDEDKLSRGDESASIRNQRLLLTEYASRMEYEVTGIYVDEDVSGLYYERPEFMRMMEDVRRGEIEIVLAKSQSRFSRNMEHVERILHHEFPASGIRFIGVCDHADTQNEGNKKARQINGLVNEWYCEDLSRNIRSVIRAKMQAGEFLGASCPYGYRKDPLNHNHLVVDDYAASVVRKIYRLYLNGYGKSKIGAVLSAEGILIPTLYKQQILGVPYENGRLLKETKTWSYQTIHKILNNEVYRGNLVQNKSNKLSYKDKKVCVLPESEWITVKNTHEAIIDETTWNMVKERQRVRTRNVSFQQGCSLFSGKVFCADCKKAMTAYSIKGREEGYLCKTYKRQGKRFCESHRITKERLEMAVRDALKEEVRRQIKEEERKKLCRMCQAEKGTKGKNRLLQYEKEIEKIKRYRLRCMEQFFDGKMEEEEYREYCVSYEERIQVIQKQIEREQKIQEKESSDPSAEAMTLLSEIEQGRLQKDIIRGLIRKIDIRKNGDIVIYYRFREDRNSIMKRSMCGDGGTHCGERSGICEPDE